MLKKELPMKCMKYMKDANNTTCVSKQYAKKIPLWSRAIAN